MIRPVVMAMMQTMLLKTRATKYGMREREVAAHFIRSEYMRIRIKAKGNPKDWPILENVYQLSN